MNNATYTGYRCIGSRTSARTEEALRRITEAVIALIRKDMYRSVATTAVQNGSMRVYVPAGGLDEGNVDDFFANASSLISAGNEDGEPCYPSLEDGNRGRNGDGSRHGGFLVIDVIARVVVDLVNTNGTTRLKTPLVQFNTKEKVVVFS